MFARANVADYNDPGDIYEVRVCDFKTENIGYVIFVPVQSVNRSKLLKN